MIIQLIRFAIVGVIAAIVDVGVLVTLKELFHVDVLVSSAVSFCVSVLRILGSHFLDFCYQWRFPTHVHTLNIPTKLFCQKKT